MRTVIIDEDGILRWDDNNIVRCFRSDRYLPCVAPCVACEPTIKNGMPAVRLDCFRPPKTFIIFWDGRKAVPDAV